ncbi:uncharacterized protein LOC124106569 isoform X1 [Marmota monax]|uniref:uncharacterized protein LOC124106569 isoform X1 n=1 Tax=Marmota monax TaxID=9995 RepID=UPI0026EF37DD|nr:uncharacterized protein LOC124106569 isoform X1 [Marmota monax]
MPKNKGKGGKNRCRGKNENESEKRELVFKEDGQVYAQVIKMLGNGRLEAMCFDGIKRLCHIRGKLRKKVWINSSDIILVGLRDYQLDDHDEQKGGRYTKPIDGSFWKNCTTNDIISKNTPTLPQVAEPTDSSQCIQLKLMKQILLVLEMMMKFSLMILEMMMKILMISNLKVILRIVPLLKSQLSPAKKNKISFRMSRIY